ncbi:sodium:proton antiporter NhaD [Marinobacterium sedimentorum]|uniref:sodium:proton antiporter NhaD n=1 Tax=Marinobacterium sedimentorum TaxID=2927804 RepID=UPI0020C6D868|nr:sodium:proton antiporter NhaD [Marinobacterium sedimentorum]MCP8686942.1 sodium:proton antiporter NhaD [Marinobacterium sedimentorum]
MHWILLSLIVLAFVLIVAEDFVHINKAKSSLFLGTLVWLLAFIFPEPGTDAASIQTQLNENLLDIATLWLFLMAAMTFVAYLNQQGLITQMVYRILPARIGQRQLMLLMAMLALAFSSLADNITASLIMLSLLSSLKLKTETVLKFAALLVFAVNSGGVSLITGDVTTLMIFLAGKVEISNLFLLIPAAILGVIVLLLTMLGGTSGELDIPHFRRPVAGRDKVIALLFVLTIGSTLFMSVYFSVPPVLSFLFGLSVMFLMYQFLNRNTPSSQSVLEYIREIEFDTLLFFLGVLLLVGMLKELSVLEHLPALYQVMPVYAANYVVGLLSALVDNVPLTAAILKSGIDMDRADWMGLTYAAGVGGSLLIIGSAAGVIAMSKIEALSFATYLRFLPRLLLAYSVGYVAVLAIANSML